MARVEPVEEALAGEEVGLGALLGENVDLAPAVLLELVLGERGLRQDLGEKREAGVEILFENGEARDRRVAAGGDLEVRREVVDRFGERARVAPARSAEKRLAGDLGRAFASRRIGRAARAREEHRDRHGGAAAPARRAQRETVREPRAREGRQEERQRGQGWRGQAARGAHAASLDSSGSLGTTVTTERRGATRSRAAASRTAAASSARTASTSCGKRPGSPS